MPSPSAVRSLLYLAVATLTLCAFHPAPAQAPANAPAGANGICKDGTFSTAAAKSGACRGHKGVQTWYQPASAAAAAPGAKSKPSPAAPSAAPSMPAPRPDAADPTSSAPATSTMRSAPAQTQAPAMPAPRSDAADPTRSASAATPPKPGISAERAKLSTMQPAAGGGPGLVWVNGSSKVYHCSGSEFYGKTKTGSYMSEADAKAKGAHADHNKPCS